MAQEYTGRIQILDVYMLDTPVLRPPRKEGRRGVGLWKGSLGAGKGGKDKKANIRIQSIRNSLFSLAVPTTARPKDKILRPASTRDP